MRPRWSTREYLCFLAIRCALHLVYISYVIFGQLAIMIGWPLRWGMSRNPWFRISHLLMIVIVAIEALVDYPCPLTTWELALRAQAGQNIEAKDMSFIGRMVHEVVFLADGWDDLTYCYYGVAGLLLATFVLAPPRFRRRPVYTALRYLASRER